MCGRYTTAADRVKFHDIFKPAAVEKAVEMAAVGRRATRFGPTSYHERQWTTRSRLGLSCVVGRECGSESPALSRRRHRAAVKS
jgi:hypothetical protein